MANGMSMGTVAAMSIVVVLMVGATFMFMFYMAMDDPDSHEITRHHSTGGSTWGGEDRTGIAEAVYTPENSNFHTYTFTMSIGTSDGMFTESSKVVFGSGYLPLQTLYEHTGTESIDGMEVGV